MAKSNDKSVSIINKQKQSIIKHEIKSYKFLKQYLSLLKSCYLFLPEKWIICLEESLVWGEALFFFKGFAKKSFEPKTASPLRNYK